MRVLFVVNTFPPHYTGGAETANLRTCQALMQQGLDCSVLVLNNRVSECVDEWYELEGIPVHRVTHMAPRYAFTELVDRRFYRLVRAELARLRPNLVHIHNVSGATLAPYLACCTADVPVVNTLHDLWLLCPNNMLYRQDGSLCDPGKEPRDCHRCFRRYDFWANVPCRRRLFRALTANVRRFVSPSQAVIDRHVEAGYAAERFRLVRLGFSDKATHSSAPTPLSDGSVRKSSRRTLAFAGGGVEIKGAVVLLRALPGLLEAVDGVTVLVAGAGEERILSQFRCYAPAVRLLGRLPPTKMTGLYALSDLTLVPSVWHENSPMVIGESFESGTPVVGSNVGGIPELIRHGETGYLFPRGDDQALVATVTAHFLRTAAERRRMRHNCRREVSGRLAMEKHVQGLMQVYSEVLNGT